MDDIKKILVGINWPLNDDQKDDIINRDALSVSILDDINNNSKFEPIGILISISNGLQIFEKSNETLMGFELSLPGSDQNPGFNDTYADGNVNSANARASSQKDPPGNPNTTETLQELIARLESSNNYNIVVGGAIDGGLTTRTVEQNRAKYGNSALGKYQIQYNTFKDVMGNTNLIFSPETQDAAYLKLLERRGLSRYRNGEISIETFAYNLSKEWAALPKNSSNKSYYEGEWGNKGLTTWPTVLKAIRNSYN